MGLFKNVTQGIRKAVKKLAPKPKIPKPIDRILPKPGDNISIDAGDVLGALGDKVKEASKDVVGAAGTAMNTAADFIEDTEHFMKTGDWNRAVETLQKEERATEGRMQEAQGAYDIALRDYVAMATKLKSLSIVHEGARFARPDTTPGMLGAPKQMSYDVNPDLYGSVELRAMDKIGLGKIADVGRAIQTLTPVRMPHSLLMQQPELAQAKKMLNENIQLFRKKTVKITRETAELIEQTDKIAVEVAALEEDFISRGLDIATGATQDLAQSAEDKAAREIAVALISAGMSVEDVARATELDPTVIAEIANAA